MDLLFFDLDGTLLNKSSEISSFTKETLVSLLYSLTFIIMGWQFGILPETR